MPKEGGGERAKNSMEWQMRWIKWIVMLKLEHTFVWPTYALKTTSQHCPSVKGESTNPFQGNVTLAPLANY
jgi:hypothetical protein